MIGISAWIMGLALVRDRAALAMTFLLPPLLFVAFAAIFAGASGRDLKIKVGLADTARTASSTRLVAALRADANFRFILLDSGGEKELGEAVARGVVDVGVLIRGDLERRPEDGPAPILVLDETTRPLAGAIATGEVQRTLNEKLPDVALARILADVEKTGAIQREDRDFLADAFHKEAAERAGSGFTFARILDLRSADGAARGGNGNVLYYAAAVAAIFLLFGAVHGAMAVLDERESGTIDRLMLTRGAVAGMMAGRFLFLAAQGVVQAMVIYAAAFAVYGASFGMSAVLPWLLACAASAAAAAGLALLACTLCASRKQAEHLTTFIVLLLSAVGGSMVPRYLMPPWFQQIGWWTPNAWIIQALDRAALPGLRLDELALTLGVLLAMALATGGLAAAIAARRHGYRPSPARSRS